jgi:hypothetical protein
MNGILKELQMTQTEFKEVCILSGTDYNIQSDNTNTNTNINTNINNKINLHSIIKIFKQFKSEKCSESFYDWLLKHTSYISNLTLLEKINHMFELNNSRLDAFQNLLIVNGPKMKEQIEEIMKEEDFIFLHPV